MYIFIQLFTDFNKASYKVQYVENNLKKFHPQNCMPANLANGISQRLCQAGQVILSYTES